jgi:ABC-type molybdate transport system substrate-binding protein
MSRTMSRLAAIAVFLIAQAGLVKAAEVKVFSTIGVQAALEELAPKFEQANQQQTQYHLGHRCHPG